VELAPDAPGAPRREQGAHDAAAMAVYGVLGDIHGNREALVAVLDELDARGVTRILCVGDIVGYNADPDECVELLREREAACIAGNHDLIGTSRLGFDRCSNKAAHSLKRTRKVLHDHTAAWLATLPSSLPIEDRFVLVHGGVRDVEQYMTHTGHVTENARHLRADFPGRTICFYGHTHEQRVFEVDREWVRELPARGRVPLRDDRLYFINAGSVDASRKRSTKRAEFAILDSASLAVDFFDVAYDDDLTESKATVAGYRLHPLVRFLQDYRIL
jgi:predicted phosphodiesterase